MKVMLLIDGDNVTDDDIVEQALERAAARHGAVHVRRMYCSAKMAADRAKLLKKLSIRPFVNIAAGKNCTDIALAIDAVDLAATERFDVAVIVSSDSDFSPLVLKLREKGCRVEGYGQDHKASDDIREVYDHFEAVERRRARTARKTATAAKTAPAAPRPAPAKAPAKARKSTAEARSNGGAAPDADAILLALPNLREGAWVPLNTAAEGLRKAKLLGRSASSPKLFGRHPTLFELEPTAKPTKVRYLGPT